MQVMSKVFRGKELPDVRHDGFPVANSELGSNDSEEGNLLRKLQ